MLGANEADRPLKNWLSHVIAHSRAVAKIESESGAVTYIYRAVDFRGQKAFRITWLRKLGRDSDHFFKIEAAKILIPGGRIVNSFGMFQSDVDQ